MHRLKAHYNLVDIKELLHIDPKVLLDINLYLLIREDNELLVLAYSDGIEDQVIWHGAYTIKTPLEEALPYLFYEEPIMSLPFKSAKICVENGNFTIVPNALIDIDNQNLWLRLNTNIENQKILSTNFTAESFSLFYSLGNDVYNFCHRSFPALSFHHSMYYLILFANYLGRHIENQLMLYKLGDNYMDVIYIADAKLVLANRYRINSSTDLIYFTTSLWRKYYLDSKLPLYIYDEGGKAREEEMKELFGKYITRVRYNYIPNSLTIEEQQVFEIKKLPLQFKVDLLCAL